MSNREQAQEYIDILDDINNIFEDIDIEEYMRQIIEWWNYGENYYPQHEGYC